MAGAPPDGLVEVLNTVGTIHLTVRGPITSILHAKPAHSLPHPPHQHVQVPDELTKNLLSRSGAICTDDRTVRLISLAAQKFVTDVVEDAKEFQTSRSQAPLAVQKIEGFSRQQDKEKDRRVALLTEDLTKALQNVRLFSFVILIIISNSIFSHIPNTQCICAVWIECRACPLPCRPTMTREMLTCFFLSYIHAYMYENIDTKMNNVIMQKYLYGKDRFVVRSVFSSNHCLISF